MILCGINDCRLAQGHSGKHETYPKTAWSFLNEVDRKKIEKAGYATPRGGDKGAYQNHVVRSNRVIIPYEKRGQINLDQFAEGCVIRLLPDQYFDAPGVVKPSFLEVDSSIQVGVNAFVLYRGHQALVDFPVLPNWTARGVIKNGQPTTSRKGNNITDTGHFVVRAPKHGQLEARSEGIVQGIFAPEYADKETNFLCRCLLAWLIVKSVGSPYTQNQASHVRAILTANGLFEEETWDYKGVTRMQFTACPLCTKLIKYEELNAMLSLEDEEALANAGVQIEGATRSTVVNLFHLLPLNYNTLDHVPGSVAWGHAICNTKLGQRRCFSLPELTAGGLKVAVINGELVETFGWISESWEMIRSPLGSTWIRISGDRPDEEVAV